MNSNSLAYHANIHSYQLVLEYILPDMYNPKYWKKINSKYSYMHIQLVTGFTLDFSIYLANTGITHWRVVKSTFSIPKLCFWILDFLLLGEYAFSKLMKRQWSEPPSMVKCDQNWVFEPVFYKYSLHVVILLLAHSILISTCQFKANFFFEAPQVESKLCGQPATWHSWK
jgi:hypothetical protein